MEVVLLPFIFLFHCLVGFFLSYFFSKMHYVLLSIVIKKKEISQINYSLLSIYMVEAQPLLF